MGEKERGEEVKEVDGRLGSGEVEELGRWWERRRKEGGKKRVYGDNNGSNPTFICGSHHVGAVRVQRDLGLSKSTFLVSGAAGDSLNLDILHFTIKL